MAQSEAGIRGKIKDGVVCLGANVLVRPDVASNYHGKLAVAENSKVTYPTTGTIEKIGMALTEVEIDDNGVTSQRFLTPLCEGDRIVFSKYAGVECRFEDDLRICLPASDVLLIVDANLKK